MNQRFVISVFSVALCIFMSCIAVNAAGSEPDKPDIIIKISRIQQALDLIDKMSAADLDQPTSAPSFFLRSMLFGIDWIDPDRPIVIGIRFENLKTETKPTMAAFVPYVRQNEDFHISYGAVSKIDHYLIAIPPGSGNAVSDEMAYDLGQAAGKTPDGLLSMEIAVSRLLNKADTKIQKMILDFDNKIKKQTNTTGDLAPEDVNTLIKNLIQMAKQVETFSLGMDLTESDLTIFSDALALKGTELSKLFTRSPGSNFTHMETYSPRRHINFKSASYDMKGMLAFFNTVFGEFYQKIGFDLASVERMASHFTGEMAGGISLTDAGMDIEMIAVLSDTEKTSPDFMESVYMPWIMDYGRTMADFYSQTSGKKINNIFSKTSPSTIDGHKVFGVSCEVPITVSNTTSDTFKVNFRTVALGKLLITAADDARLKQLMTMAGSLIKKPYDGPLMNMDIKLGAYLNAVQAMLPEPESGERMHFSDLGSLVYSFDFGNRKLSNKYVIQVDDIRSIVSAFKQAQAASVAAGKAEDDAGYAAPTLLQQSGEAQPPAPPKEDTAEFWLDKGLLYATYGNDTEAIKFYQKALGIDPDNPKTLFNIGISYSSLGKYEQAIDAFNRALFLNPDNGDYHYGLGWVYLLKGESGKAMQYIRSAADLGNPDAKKYLMKHPTPAK